MAKDKKSYSDIAAALAGMDPGELSALLSMFAEGGEQEVGPYERREVMDPMMRMGQFRNQGYRPGGTGKVHFMGGSPFPQSAGQQRAEKVLAGGMFAGNILDSLNSVVPAIVDAWRKRKGQGGGQ